MVPPLTAVGQRARLYRKLTFHELKVENILGCFLRIVIMGEVHAVYSGKKSPTC